MLRCVAPVRWGRLPGDENHVTRFLPLLRAPSLVKRGITRGDVIPAPIAKLTGYFVDPAPRTFEFQVVSNRGLIADDLAAFGRPTGSAAAPRRGRPWRGSSLAAETGRVRGAIFVVAKNFLQADALENFSQ